MLPIEKGLSLQRKWVWRGWCEQCEVEEEGGCGMGRGRVLPQDVVGVACSTHGDLWWLGSARGVCEYASVHACACVHACTCVCVRVHALVFLGSDHLGAAFCACLVFLIDEIGHLQTQHLHYS